LGEGRQHDGELLGRSFQARERCVASSTEGGMTSLTAKRLDALGTAMRAIAYERMHVSSCDPAVSARRASTGIPFGVDADGVLRGDFSPRSMAAPEQAPVLQPTRAWRRDDRQSSRLGSGAQAVGGACCESWRRLSTGRDQDEESRGHAGAPERRSASTRAETPTRSWSMLFVWNEEECFLPRKEKKDCREGSQAGRSVVRFIHHR
jgi:hypothetical protein